MNKDSVADLKKKLKQMGYSDKTAEEVLKSYGVAVSQADENRERNLRPSDFRQQKSSH